MEKIKRIGELNLDEIISHMEEADFQSYMTAGIVISGTNLDLFRLKYILYQLQDSGDLNGFKVIHFQITPEKLRIVKKEDWEIWRLERK